MPSAANGKTEKPASAEASDNSPIRQIMTIIDHKIRNLEKRKSKLTSYRDLQKAGKELNADQKVAVAKYDEVAQTLEFARDLSKQITGIAASAERDLKKQAKKEAWVRYAAETSKIREVLLIFDCLNLMGAPEVREDFLNGSNGAAKLTENDLKILDDLYPEVNPKHEVNEEGQPGFHGQVTKAAEHLYAIADGKPKEVLGTTYTHIKNIISAVHECGYFDKGPETHEVEECPVPVEPEIVEEPQIQQMPQEMNMYPQQPANLPVPPAPAVVPPPAYPLRAMPPITLQEVEHAYFAQQYPQPRPISEVIGSQNFFFLQESEIDSPVATPQPPMVNQQSPQGPIPTQTFTNQHFVQIAGVRHPAEGMGVPQAHFAPPPEHGSYPVAMAPPPMGHVPVPLPQHVPHPMPQHLPPEAPATPPAPAASPPAEENDDWAEAEAPEKEADDAKAQPANDGNRFRRFKNGGSRGGGRGPSNGFRGRSYPNRQSGEGYHGRQGNDNFQGRSNKDGYNRQYYSGYQNRNKDNYQGRNNNDNYYGNGDAGNGNQQNESAGTRDRYSNNNSNDGGYQGGFKSRGRGGPRGARGASRGNRTHYSRENDHAE